LKLIDEFASSFDGSIEDVDDFLAEDSLPANLPTSARKQAEDVCISYSPEIIKEDYFYRNFLQKHSCCILEDSDILLESREKYNENMHRLLNITDGIFDVGKKKMVISTNIMELSRIDPALLRPGRCFDVLEFRSLTLDEANVVREKIKLEPLKEKKSYTLAEIFNNNMPSVQQQKIGLI
jgi:hypothetical protein